MTFVLWQNETMHGPFAAAELKRMFDFGEVADGALVAEDGQNDWAPFETRKTEIMIAAESKEHTCSRCGKVSMHPRNAPIMNLLCNYCATPLAKPLMTSPPATPSALVKCPDCGKDVSRRASSCPNCGAPIAGTQPAPRTPSPIMVMPVRPAKSRGAYIVLALLVGGLGIHNMYAGYVGRGLCQLAVFLVLGWLIVPIVVLWIVAIIEACTVDQDAYGIAMV